MLKNCNAENQVPRYRGTPVAKRPLGKMWAQYRFLAKWTREAVDLHSPGPRTHPPKENEERNESNMVHAQCALL